MVSRRLHGDGKVDALDLNMLAANWQFGAASLQAALGAVAVPEPGTLGVMALGVTMLVRRRRGCERTGKG